MKSSQLLCFGPSGKVNIFIAACVLMCPQVVSTSLHISKHLLLLTALFSDKQQQLDDFQAYYV